MLLGARLDILVEILLILFFRCECLVIFGTVLFVEGCQIVIVLDMPVVTILRIFARNASLGFVLGNFEVEFRLLQLLAVGEVLFLCLGLFLFRGGSLGSVRFLLFAHCRYLAVNLFLLLVETGLRLDHGGFGFCLLAHILNTAIALRVLGFDEFIFLLRDLVVPAHDFLFQLPGFLIRCDALVNSQFVFVGCIRFQLGDVLFCLCVLNNSLPALFLEV